MIGTIGLDVQTRSSGLAILEQSQERALPVGDGIRRLVPNAYDSHGWGSAAARSFSPRQATRPRRGEALHPWVRSPWNTEFFKGIHTRLSNYLGQTAPTPNNGYQLAISLPPAGAEEPDAEFVLALAAGAGFTEASIVNPADALICCWLAEQAPGHEPPEIIGAVACGEEWTVTAAYRLSLSSSRPRVSRLDAPEVTRHPAVTGPDALMEMLKERGTGMDDVGLLLEITDGVDEYLQALGALGRDEKSLWSGPGSERLYTPVRLSWAEVADWPAYRERISTTAALVGPVARASGASTFVVGGRGSVGSFVVKGLQAAGISAQVCCQDQPDMALAVGAAWWRQRPEVIDSDHPRPSRPSIAARRSGRPAPEGETGSGPTPAVPETEIPPWER